MWGPALPAHDGTAWDDSGAASEDECCFDAGSLAEEPQSYRPPEAPAVSSAAARATLDRLIQQLAHGQLDFRGLVGSVEALVALLRCADRPAVECSRVLLQHLARDETAVARITEVGGAGALLALLEDPPDCAVVENVVNSIWFLCCTEANVDLRLYDAERGLEASLMSLVLRVLQAKERPADHRPAWASPEVTALRPLVGAMHRLALIDHYRRRLTEVGAIETCVKLLDADASEERVTALRTLSLLLVDNSVEFVAVGGVPVVAHMLWPTVGHPSEHGAALDLCAQLFELRGDLECVAEQLVQANAVPALVALLRTDDPNDALRVLCYLVQHGPSDTPLIAANEHALVPTLLALLRGGDLSTQSMSAGLLWSLCLLGDEVTEQVLLKGGVPFLKELQRSADPVVRHNATGVLRCLECFDDLEQDSLGLLHPSLLDATC